VLRGAAQHYGLVEPKNGDWRINQWRAPGRYCSASRDRQGKRLSRLGSLRFARRRSVTFRLCEVSVTQQMSQCILQIRHGDRCQAADPRRNQSPRSCSSRGGGG
jgi:hypothetical protein